MNLSGGATRARPYTPSDRSIGVLFAIGSVCFALGSMPWYFDALADDVVAWTFFVGSIFFTSAGTLQYLQAHGAPRATDWWAGLIQLLGTVFFNISTFAATREALTTNQDRRLVWSPDVFGSICFLVASWLAFAALNRGIRPRPDGTTGWRIAALNMMGSIAFGIAAVAGRYLRTTDQTANLALDNLGTFLGAVCFLLGAVLLPGAASRDAARG